MVAKKFNYDFDFQKNRLLNVGLQVLSSAPSSPIDGQMYFDSTLKQFGVYSTSNAAWTYLTTGAGFGNVTKSTAATAAGVLQVSGGTDKSIADISITAGLLKVASSGVPSVAVAGTDYLTPTGSGAALTGITESQITGLVADLAAKAPLASPALTGTPTAPTASAATNTTQLATTAFVTAAVGAVLGANDAMVFKGVIDASANPNYPAANAGDTYKISVAGKIGGASGPNVEVGDMILATADGLSAGTQAAVGASWTIIQTNIDGAVTGPASSVSGNLATFSGTTGKLLADSGKAAPTGTIVGTTDTQALTNKDLTGAGNVFPTFNQSTTGNAATATKLATARTINGVAFDGTANITIAAVRQFAQSIGDGTTTSFPITHGLGTQNIHVMLRDNSTNEILDVYAVATSTTVATLSFNTAPTAGQYTAIIQGS